MPSSDGTWESKRCDAITKRDADGQVIARCKRWAIRGGTRCPIHGGSTQKAKDKARQNRQQAAVGKVVTTYGLPREIAPVDAFLEELARTNGHVTWLASKIQELPENELVWNVIEKKSRNAGVLEGSFDEETLGAVANIWLKLYIQERQQLVKVSDIMIKNGLAEMQLRLSARMMDLFEGAMVAILQDLRITPSDPAVRNAIARRMGEAAVEAQKSMAIMPGQG